MRTCIRAPRKGKSIQIGEKFGKLTVVEDLGFYIKQGTINEAHYYKCKCDCGATIDVNGVSLRAKRTKSCGRCDERELIGFRSGKLEVVSCAGYRDNQLYMHCRCDCGNEVDVLASNLKKYKTKSCGHCNEFDLIGKRFGGLVVESSAGRDQRGDLFLNCKCDCGNTTVVRYANLVKENGTRSCDECYEFLPESYKPEIRARIRRLNSIWKNIHKRCTDTTHESYHSYGGRGIRCDLDRMEFIKLYYLDESFQLDLEADRFDNSGNYSVKNIRWVSRSVNMKNTIITNPNSYESIATRLIPITTFASIIHSNNYIFDEFTPYRLIDDKGKIADLFIFIHQSIIDCKYEYLNNIKEYYRKNGAEVKFQELCSSKY